jgi:hypothetical protein
MKANETAGFQQNVCIYLEGGTPSAFNLARMGWLFG